MLRVSGLFVAIAFACLLAADISITTLDPWTEMKRMALGAVTPDFTAVTDIGWVLLRTVAFAFCGVALGAVGGFLLSQLFHYGPVRWGCAFVRAIHELFWALIFLQMFGLTPLTGVLAIALPYAGICAKVYAETLEEGDQRAVKVLAPGTDVVSAFLYARLPGVWVHIKNYTSYRFECGLRSSAVLGFVGLPTLGFYLETAFSEGNYSEAAALMILFYILIASLRMWVRPKFIALYAIILPFFLGGGFKIEMSNIVRFFSVDIVPAPLRDNAGGGAERWSDFADWLWLMVADMALPGIIATVLLTQIALVGTGVLALLMFPLISKKFFGPVGRSLGHGFLVIVRSTPEFILAYVFLQLWGPSMLPAIVALALHNGAIIGHLMGRFSDEVTLRPDHARGLNLYSYEMLPRIYGQFLAYLFYRWEVIMRETAILGILGIATLGFFIDSALSEIRIDRAMFLIVVTAALNIGIDILSRRIRLRLHLSDEARQLKSPA